MKLSALGLSALAAFAFAGSGAAQELRVSGTTVTIDLTGSAFVEFDVAGPKGFHQQVSSKGSSASIKLGGSPADGVYKYEASGTTSGKTESYNPLKLDNGREKEPTMVNVGSSASGTFLVERGVIILPKPGSGKEDKDS